MAREANLSCRTYPAGADLSAKQFYAVKLDSAAAVVLAGAGEAAIGILQNNPTSGQAATVAIAGRSKMVAGAAVASGARVASNASGKGVTATAGKVDTSDAGAASDPVIGSNIMGICVDAAANADEIMSVELLMMGVGPTTAA